jgi:ribosomal protein S6E (S10)
MIYLVGVVVDQSIALQVEGKILHDQSQGVKVSIDGQSCKGTVNMRSRSGIACALAPLPN